MIYIRRILFLFFILSASLSFNEAIARRSKVSNRTATDRLQPVLTMKNFGKINDDLKTLNDVFQFKKDGKPD